MGTLKQAVDRVTAAKTAIGNAITAKGGTVNQGDGLEEFAADIGTITNQYSAADEGKVVSNGALVSQTSYPSTITQNNTYDTTNYNSVTVDVPTSNYIIIPCTYDSAITDETYYKDTPQLIIDTVNKTVQFIANFYRKSGYNSVWFTATPTIPLSEIFDAQTVFTVKYQAIGTNQGTAGGGSFYRLANPTNAYYIIDISNNTITINSSASFYLYGGITAYVKWTYQ